VTSREAVDVCRLAFSGPAHILPSRFAVTEAAVTSVSAAFSAERLLRLDGKPVGARAELSGSCATGEGRYLQLHCNLPHHA
jgi:hypothetical protein